MNKQKFTAQIEVQAIISQAQKELAKLGKDVNKSWQDGSPPKGMLKQLESMRTRLTSLQNLTSEGIIDSSGLSSAKNDFKGLSKEIRQLTIEYQLFTTEQKKAMLSPEEQSNMKARTEAMNKYTQALKENQRILKERADIEQKQTTTLANKKQLESQKKGLQDRVANYADDSYLSKEAREYAKNLREEAALKEEILRLDKKIEAERRKGTPEESKRGGNDLTRAKDQRAEKENQLKSLDLASGKAAYEKESAVQKQNIQQLENEIKSIDAQIEEANTSLEGFEKTLKNLKPIDVAAEFNKLKQSLKECGVEGIDNVKDFDELKKIVQKLDKDALSKVDKTVKNFVKQLKLMEEQVDQVGEALEDATDSIKNQEAALARANAIEDRIKSFLGFAGATEVLKTSARRAMATIKELDATMTEMAVVTDLTVGDYWDQLPQYSKQASDLGVSINSAYRAATLYYQQGLKTNEVNAISVETLKMARIAGLDASTATDKMTAALRGFNMELNETSAQRVSDVYSELAAITAADTKEIANAMTKTASIASNAGMEFETTAAFLSQIIETTRESAETAGTAMKTVIARFQELKKDPAEIGEVDGEIVDANKIETALRSVGVSLRDANGQFRALDDVFLELSSKWDTLDTNTQRYIATIAAGSRQQSRFIAMMSDYGRTQELVAAANNSAGASNRQFEKTMDSLESKLEKLKNAWDEFSMGILNSDLVKVGVDILTKFLEIINKATSTFDGLGGSIMKVISVITLFKLGQKIFDKFKQPLMKFFADVVTMVRDTGFKSGEAYVEAVRQGGQSAQTKKATTTTTESQSNKQKFLQATGISDIVQGGKQAFTKNAEDEAVFNKLIYGDKVPTSETRAERKTAIATAREQRVKAVNDAKAPIEQQKAYFEDMKAGRNGVLTKKGKLFSKNSNEYRKAEKMSYGTKEQQEALKAAEEELKKFDDTQTKVQTRAAEGWAQAGQGLQKMGMEIAAVGVGISMLGGLFDALGMEEVGEAFSTFGNILTVVGTGISAVGTALSAIPPLLTLISSHPIVAIIVAACAVILLAIVGITKALQDASLENRMAKAAEATEKAKTAANEAKEAYDELLTEKEGYDEMQRNLEELTYGTKEWKEALHEVNEQVLKLLQTYPELSKYLSRGNEGQLIITDEGWDALIKEQDRAVNNTQNLVLSRQITEQKLKEEEARTKFNEEASISNAQVTKEQNGNVALVDGSYMLQNDLEEIYLLQNSTLAEQSNLVDELAKKYHTSTDNIWAVADALAESKDQILAVADATENVARANLTAQASQAITESEFGDEVIDAFSQSVASEEEERREEEIFKEMRRAYMNTNLKSYAKTEEGKNIKAIADTYGVNLEAGTDKQNLQEMYSKMTGKSMQEVKDTKMSKADLAKEISAMWVGTERNTKMEEYLAKLEELAQTDEKTANDISSIFSDDGRTMTLEFANELMSGDDKQFNSEVLKKQAEQLGYSLDAWAKALNKTEAELLKEAEDNARKAQNTNKKTFDQLNRVLGRADGDITAFGTNLGLTVENQASLAQKLVGATQVAGKEAGNTLQGLLDTLLNSASEDADKMAEVLKGINWSDAEDISFENLSELFQNLNIKFNSKALKSFTEEIKTIGIIVETVNFDKLNQELNTTRKLIESIQSGEQGRLFSKENYDALVKANEEIAKQFVQIGDEFHYVGASLQELSNALKKNMVLDLGKAGYQLEKQIQIGQSVRAFSEATNVQTFGADKLDAIKGTKGWSEADKRLYLEQYRAFALENGVDTLKYVTDEQGNSLNMSLSMNFNEATETQLDAYIAGLLRLEGSTEKMTEDYSKAMSDYRVNSYTLEGASNIVSGARRERKNGNEAAADEYSKALSIEASNSGLVAESVIAKYNELVEADYSKLSKPEKEQMDLYENLMLESLEQGANSLEQLEAVNDMTQSVADALYNIAQQEIEKLSNINDSINTTNERLVNKIQEQINKARQDRENKEAAQDIAQDQSQLAYLMSDTSGAGALEAQTLQQQIAEKQQNYQDTLIDQSLQRISDDNAAAAEQRERQIALMQEQLEFDKENGALAHEAENITTTALEAISNGTSPLDTKMYSILEQSEAINGGMATKAEQDAFKQTFTDQATVATNAYTTLNATASGIAAGLAAAQQELADWIAGKDKSNTDEQTGGSDAVEDTAVYRDAAIAKAVSYATEDGDVAGETLKGSKTFDEAYEQYKYAGGGSKDEFYAKVIERAAANTKAGKGDKDGGWDWVGIPDKQTEHSGLNDWGGAKFNLTIDGTPNNKVETGPEIDRGQNQRLNELYLATTGEGRVVPGDVLFDKDDSRLFIFTGSAWREVLKEGSKMDNSDGNKPEDLIAATKDYFRFTAFKTGGMADFTGPAWLDGTKSRPELVLNARDTQNFIQLKDILAEIMDKGGMSDNSTSNGDNYFDIQINVEDISDDYDVEQLANKIRSMIYEDATYRNVNAVSHISR